MKTYCVLLKGDAEAAENGAKNWEGSSYDGKSVSGTISWEPAT